MYIIICISANNEERMVELEHHHFVIPNELMDLCNEHQQLLKITKRDN